MTAGFSCLSIFIVLSFQFISVHFLFHFEKIVSKNMGWDASFLFSSPLISKSQPNRSYSYQVFMYRSTSAKLKTNWPHIRASGFRQAGLRVTSSTAGISTKTLGYQQMYKRAISEIGGMIRVMQGGGRIAARAHLKMYSGCRRYCRAASTDWQQCVCSNGCV